MIDTIYIERELLTHPRAQRILERFPNIEPVVCERYGEVFNPRGQSFRLQKQKPGLILAHKRDGWLLPAPSGCHIGWPKSFYLSPLGNCLYDCRYCFLQGMYGSAHYLLFVNYEDFAESIVGTARASDDEVGFFLGIDSDALALEELTGLSSFFLEAIESQSNAWIELRTKSVRIQHLLERSAHPRAVIAFSLTPDPVARAVEHGAPTLERRVTAMSVLAERGWQVGVRLDPIIYHHDWQENYRQLIETVVASVNVTQIHSVTLGAMRFPKDVLNRMVELYPKEPILAGPFEMRDGSVSYPRNIRTEMVSMCHRMLHEHLSEDVIFVSDAEPGLSERSESKRPFGG